MRIVITRASGFIGQRLVPRLAAAGMDLLLVGREPEALRKLFPGHQCCGYDDLAAEAKGAELLVHLSVRNTPELTDLAQFEEINVDGLAVVLSAAKEANVGKVLAVSSTQVLDLDNQTPYVASKRSAVALLDATTGIETRTVYLPLVYGDGFAGPLARLNQLPKPLVRIVFPVLAALKPTVHIDRVAEHILAGAEGGIVSDGQAANPAYKILRTILDWSFALSILGLLWWALLIVWVWVSLSSPGPGLFVQTRVGRGGRAFKLYKFRTMAQGTKQAGTHEVTAAAVTPVGAFLRRTKLDELPQILNILKGELSLIGPRPCLPVQQELVAERQARGVLSIRPGISGLAQIEDIDMSDPVRLAKRDADYVALQTFLLDLKITLATVRGRGQGDRTA